MKATPERSPLTAASLEVTRARVVMIEATKRLEKHQSVSV